MKVGYKPLLGTDPDAFHKSRGSSVEEGFPPYRLSGTFVRKHDGHISNVLFHCITIFFVEVATDVGSLLDIGCRDRNRDNGTGPSGGFAGALVATMLHLILGRIPMPKANRGVFPEDRKK